MSAVGCQDAVAALTVIMEGIKNQINEAKSPVQSLSHFLKRLKEVDSKLHDVGLQIDELVARKTSLLEKREYYACECARFKAKLGDQATHALAAIPVHSIDDELMGVPEAVYVGPATPRAMQSGVSPTRSFHGTPNATPPSHKVDRAASPFSPRVASPSPLPVA
eukprot:2039908-Alexandrium_andersonii.AAC.1